MNSLYSYYSRKEQAVFVAACLMATCLILPPAFFNVVAILSIAYTIFRTKPSPQQWFMLLPVLLFICVILWSNDLGKQGRIVEKNLMLVLFPLYFFLYGSYLNKKEIGHIFMFFCASIILASVICYIGAIINIIQHGGFKVAGLERDYYYFSYLHLTNTVSIDPIYLSLNSNFALAITLFESRYTGKIKFALAVYLTIFIFLIAAKVGLMCFVIIILIYSFVTVKKKIVLLSFIILMLVLIASGIYKVDFLKDRLLNNFDYQLTDAYGGNWNSYSQRLAIWECSWKTMKKKIIMGYGTGEGQQALEKTYLESKFVRGVEDKYNAHNQFFQTTLDFGIVGLFVLLVILVAPLAHFNSLFSPTLFIFIFLIIAFSMVESILVRQKGMCFFTLFYGLTLLNARLGRI